MAAADYPQMLAMVESEVLRPDLLVEKTVGFNKAISVLAAMGDSSRDSVGGITVFDPKLAG
jgi:hypothetical protein